VAATQAARVKCKNLMGQLKKLGRAMRLAQKLILVQDINKKITEIEDKLNLPSIRKGRE